MVINKYPVIFAAVLSAWCRTVSAGTIDVSTIVVTAARMTLGVPGELTAVRIIDRQQIEKSAFRNVAAALNSAGLDVQSRGGDGVQGDITFRGGGFEDVLILLDGARINDPQTGHHNADIPLALNDVERIEILSGGSALYGTGTGIVNIVTRRAGKRRAAAKLAFAREGTSDVSAYYGTGGAESFGNFSVSKKKSRGFLEGRDYSITSAYGAAGFESATGRWLLKASAQEKEFGAYDFYTPGWGMPSFEQTGTQYAAVANEYDSGVSSYRTQLYFRRHTDDFMLDRNKPGWYENNHITRVAGMRLDAGRKISPESKLLYGFEGIRNSITSDALGAHDFRQRAVFAGLFLGAGNFLLNPGARYDSHSRWGGVLLPEFALSWRFFPGLSWRNSVSKTRRTPSFTELYYPGLANKGTPELKDQRNVSFESAVKYAGRGLSAGLNYFTRREKNVIDWTAQTSTSPWRAVNLGRLTVSGFEADLNYGFLTAGYIFTVTSGDKPGYSKYALRNPKHQLNVSASGTLPAKLTGILGGVYKKREKEGGYFVMNARLGRKIGSFEVFAGGENILNRKYEEVAGVPMPGRRIYAGASVSF